MHNHDWTCPQCGGWAFGSTTRPNPDRPDGIDIVERQCHSDTNGKPLSEDGSGKPCGWRGPPPEE